MLFEHRFMGDSFTRNCVNFSKLQIINMLNKYDSLYLKAVHKMFSLLSEAFLKTAISNTGITLAPPRGIHENDAYPE